MGSSLRAASINPISPSRPPSPFCALRCRGIWMSFHVSTVGRWMHLDCGGRLRPKLIALSFRPTTTPSSSCHLCARSSTLLRPAARSSTASLLPRPSPSLRCLTTTALPLADVHPSAIPPSPDVSDKDGTAPGERLDSLRGHGAAETKRKRSVYPSFAIRPITLPINAEYLDHPGNFSKLQQGFSASIGFVYVLYRQKEALPNIRQRFRKEIRSAEYIWATRQARSVANWLDDPYDNEHRARSLVDLLVGSLLISPVRILSVLGTLKTLPDDFEIRAHCLYITGWLYKETLLDDHVLMSSFDDEVDKLRDMERWPEKRLSLDHLRLLLWRSDEDQIKSLLACLTQKYTSLPPTTLLWLTMFCSGKYAWPDEAFTFLSRIPDRMMQNPETLLLKCCQALLKHDDVVATYSGPNFRYLPELLRKGLAPDGRLYDRIIERALDCGYPVVAWDVYHHLQSSTTPTHWATHLRMLREGFVSRNAEGVDEIMTKIYQDKSLYTNTAVLTYAMNMVRRLTHTSTRAPTSQGVSQIVALYDRVFTRKSLSKFRLVYDLERESANEELVEPRPVTLAYTVWAIVLCHKHGSFVENLWTCICEAIEQADETILACMQIDLVYNAFIWLNAKHQETLYRALEIFRYMLEKQFCAPTSRTWSILICGFLYHGQKDQAKQIYELMCQHGFTLQDICGELIPAGATLEDLEERAEGVLDLQRADEAFDEEPILTLTAETESQEGERFGLNDEPSEMLYEEAGFASVQDHRLVATQ